MALYDYQGSKIADAEMPSLDTYGDLSTSSGFLAAFNAAVADTSISGVTLPYGSYTVASQLNMRSNFSVDGNNAVLNLSGNYNIFVFKDVNHCVVENLIIDMHQTKNSPSGTALYILDSSDITMRNIEIKNIGVRGCLAYTLDPTDGHYNDRITFDNVRMYGIGEKNTIDPQWPCGTIAANCRYSTIHECLVTGMSRFTLEWKNYSSFCSTINNIIIGGDEGLFQSGDRPLEEASVLGHDILYIGNRVSDVIHPVFFGRANNVIVSGNTFNGNTDSDPYGYDGTIYLEYCSDCLISNNEIYGASGSASALIGVKDNTRVYLNENIYTKGQSADLFSVTGDASTVFVTGYYDNKRMDIHNPTSGTPTA